MMTTATMTATTTRGIEMDEAPPEPTSTLSALEMLMQFAQSNGDISEYLEDADIAKLTDQVCDTYDRDNESRSEWREVAEAALKDMATAEKGEKSFPWAKASNVRYPLLPFAVMQFNARAYPAIVKGDEAVACKVVGSDNGLPVMGPDGHPLMMVGANILTMIGEQPALFNPATQQTTIVPPEEAEKTEQSAQPKWKREPGAKTKRAARVKDFMNYQLFYRMDDWETETDTLLFQMPAIGVGFRKVWYDGEKHHSRFVPALKLVVSNDATSLDAAPQIAEEIDGVFPHQIRRDIAVGKYRDIRLDPEEKEARLLIEAQCYCDLDGDGMDEPYIVTVDHKSRQLLRVVPDFGPEQIKVVNDRIAWIERRQFYVKYEFLPHPEGKFYNIGLAHLLEQFGSIIDTLINQMIDANTAAVAGGGFIASGLRIQGQGQSSSLKWKPGEYKTVGVDGRSLREGIVERTYPQANAAMFQLLELILGAAKDIASVKDILSGDASNNGQVGTTLALIEQGLQVFTAIYKRVYRGLKAEFTLLFKNVSAHATEETQADYVELLDDPLANLAEDFNGRDMDIAPVSDPSSVTQMQRMARAQFLLSTVEVLQNVGGDVREALRRVYEAANVDDIDKLLPEPDPTAGQMQKADAEATIKGKLAKAGKDEAAAQATVASVQIDGRAQELKEAEAGLTALQAGMEVGSAAF